MGDIGDRLEDIERTLSILWRDVRHLADIVFGRQPSQVLSEEQKPGDKRAFVRAVLTLIEAVVEQNKRLLLDLTEANKIILTKGIAEALSEQLYFVSDNGSVSVRVQYLDLKRKIRLLSRAGEEAFGEKIDVRFDDKGWESFINAIKIRDRLTHPKSSIDCNVSETDISTVNDAASWFLGFNSALVRVMARHRAANKW